MASVAGPLNQSCTFGGPSFPNLHRDSRSPVGQASKARQCGPFSRHGTEIMAWAISSVCPWEQRFAADVRRNGFAVNRRRTSIVQFARTQEGKEPSEVAPKRSTLGQPAMGPNNSQFLGASGKDLLVVGPGVLGSLVAQLWLEGIEGSKVVGQTNTTVNHDKLKSLGIVPVAKDTQCQEKFPYVIFCAPPSGSTDYPAEVRSAAQQWNGEGSLLFTSSSSLYDVSENGVCDEEQTAPCVPKGRGPRTDRLLNAEEEVLKVSLDQEDHSLNRGAHTFYLSQGSFQGRPDHLLNLIHYEDAATLCRAILKIESRGQIYMGCDSAPVSRREMMDAVNMSGKYEQKFKEFTGVDGTLGKRMNNKITRLATGWKPKYESFPSFLGMMVTKQ